MFPPNFELLASYTDWRRDWTHIVSGQFSASPFSGLLFYEQSTGHAEFYETDGQGGINLLRQYDDWRNSWTLIVPGRFSNPRFLPANQQYANTGFPAKTGFLLYDQQAGFGAFYDTDGSGGIIKLAEYSDWRTTWTHIIAGMFTNSPYSGLLFYDQANGYGEMYATDGAGGITLVQSYSDWRTSWTICYWRVRFEDDPELGRRMVCYKQAAFDPNSSKTINWRSIPNDRDTKLTGVSYQWTEYPPLPEFSVQEPGHWIFANTGLGLNDGFGLYDNYQLSVVGPETDVRNSTTTGFQLLAAVYVDWQDQDGNSHHDEVASMGIMNPGGSVFTAATINWALGLSQDNTWNPIDQITRNVMIRLG